MQRAASIVLGAAFGVILIVAAMWGWQRAGELVHDWEPHRPGAVLWAVRSGAVAAVAAGEVLLIGAVIGSIYRHRRDPLTDALGLSALVIFMLSLAGAVAFGLAGR